jgi:putative hydrolase of the HAD superfamily
MKYYKQHWAWIAGANSVLKWTASHCPVGILTNGFSEIQHVKYEWFNLEHVTRVFVISEEVGSAKPRKKIFEVSEQQAKTDASEILYIGDSWSSDVVGGVSAGWNVVWFNRHKLEPPDPLNVEIAHDFIQVKEIIAKHLNVYEGT